MRAGEPMPIAGKPVASDYRILVSRADERPKAQLYAFAVRQKIPTFRLPLLAGDEEPAVEVGALLHALYDRARFDLSSTTGGLPSLPLRTRTSAGRARCS